MKVIQNKRDHRCGYQYLVRQTDNGWAVVRNFDYHWTDNPDEDLIEDGLTNEVAWRLQERLSRAGGSSNLMVDINRSKIKVV